MIRALAIALALSAPGTAGAFSLEFPAGASRAAERIEELTSFHLPIGPWEAGEVQTLWAEGALLQQAWQIPSEGQTTLQLLAPLRDQLTDAGFEILFECADADCGGFDFRYATNVMPEPAMHVDLGDYRFLSAQRMGETKPEYACLLVSRSSRRGFVQLVRIGPEDGLPTVSSTSSKGAVAPAAQPIIATGPLSEQLETTGRLILDDLRFQTGSSSLDGEDYSSLSELAAYLRANPTRTVVLVGHTDAEGSLDGNIALSKKRAQSVGRVLVDRFDVAANQVDAQGVGYLSPIASNLSENGRTQNRRVEVILTSTR
ncbi:OmpA family protein [Actibacterium ureilyticum]|uniref:OmpA family protein n=1 Tax=Actibacterium ureilyticum TaxID=1590614 RepID=UPI000BAAABAE|nr:OmpA family protein [Actibacterium ureilyticum]